MRIGNNRKLKETIIRTNISGKSFAPSVKLNPSSHQFNSKSLAEHSANLRKKTRRVRVSAITSYVAIAALIVSILAVGYQPPVKEGAAADSLSRAAISIDKPSVDQVAAVELAAQVAQAANLSVASNVANLSISLNAKSQLAQNDDTLLSKPQIVQATSGRGIQQYVTVRGDNVPSLAERFGVSEDSIRWSNDISGDAVEIGKKLYIPGVTGIVYVVQGGDSIASIAERFRADGDRIITYNDAELTGLKPGQRIVIPNGIKPAATPAVYIPTYGGSYGYASSSVGNRYDAGYCTWYAYERRAQLGRPIGSFWGNATTWASFAAAAGFTVNNTPKAGAVMQSSGGWGGFGHVAIVERVYSDGSILISEMNYAGWNVKSERTLSASQAAGYRYIH